MRRSSRSFQCFLSRMGRLGRLSRLGHLGLMGLMGLPAVLALMAFAIPGVSRADEKLKVATTFTIIADMARNVAGDAAEIVSITKPGAEIHNYQPTPRDILKAQDAD